MKEILVIVCRNFFSPIVIAILTLSTVLLFFNEKRDALFLSTVIVVNTLFAIMQEIRAYRALKKLELMSAPYAYRMLPGGGTEKVLFDKLSVNDIIYLRLGDEVPADGQIISSEGLEADESVLTGESIPVEKSKKSIVYAVSVIVAGSATMRVTAVGADTKVGSMTSTLKQYKQQLTPLQLSIAKAITWLTFGAICLAILIYIVYSLSNQEPVLIFKTIAVAAVTVVPEGLLLASTLLLAFGSLRLAQAKVLPQKIAAIEAMALLNVLCVDKTGTLTSDKITFEKIELLDKKYPNITDIIGIISKETGGSSTTGEAIIKGVPAPNGYKVIQILAFSSARKMSGIKIDYGGKIYSLLLGAPEIISNYAPLSIKQRHQIDILVNEGKRVLLAAVIDNTNNSLKNIKTSSGHPLGLVILSNELRQGLEKTINYLQKNGVSLRVISGDNPNTVRFIAKKAGILNYQKVITGLELENVKNKDWDKIISETIIFARVLPEQKEKIIDTFIRIGNFTGMVGDGVNDALALKKSNLGVAMYSGAVATRRVADVVLLDNSFNSLPMGMKLGNKIIQAIELIAALFFHKIIYGVLLLFITIIAGEVYPFAPRHITFMNIFLVTLPTVIWALSPPTPRMRLSPRHFWHDTLLAITPIAILTGIVIAVSYLLLHNLHPDNPNAVSTTIVILATLFGIYVVFLVPRMFDVIGNRKFQLTRILYVLTVLLVIIPSFGLSFARDFFDFTMPILSSAWVLLIVIVCTAILQWIIAGNTGKRFKKNQSILQ